MFLPRVDEVLALEEVSEDLAARVGRLQAVGFLGAEVNLHLLSQVRHILIQNHRIMVDFNANENKFDSVNYSPYLPF